MENKKTLSLLLVLALLVLPACGVFSAVSGQAAGLPANIPAGAQATAVATAVAPVDTATQPAVQAPSHPAPELIGAYEHTLEDVYNRVNPSVVNIQVAVQSSSNIVPQQPFPFFGQPGTPNLPQQGPQYGYGLGSGFVWSQDGYIVTNNHVVNGASSIEVTFSDGTTVPAELVGADAFGDLAVIKVNAAPDLLKPVELGDSSALKVGELAIAIGSPFGQQGTMTVGIISALGRSLPLTGGQTTGPSYSIPDVIQTDAPINPGNSGGVLLNDAGQVVGVTAAIESPVRANAGIGYAIPAQIVQRIIPELIKNGSYQHAWLGISGGTLVPDLAQAMNLPADTRGALVAEVVTGGPAEKAGLRGSNQQATILGQQVLVGGDVIVAIDGHPVQSMDELIAYLFDQTQAGQTVTLTVLRDGKQQQIDVILGVRPDQNPVQNTSTP